MKRNNNVDKEIYQAPTVKESIKVAMSESPLEEFQLELMQTLSQFDKWKEANPDKSYDDFLREVGLDRVELSSGGLSRESLLEMLKNEYPKEFNRYKNLSTKELKELLNNLDTSGVPFKKGGDVKKKEVPEPMSINIKPLPKRFASEDPVEEFEIDLIQELMMKEFEEFKKKNPDFKGTYKDFMNLTKRTSPLNELILSSAMQKLSDRTSGIGGLMTDGSLADTVRLAELSPEESQLVSKKMGRRR